MSHILWIWILFSRLNSWLKMSIIDCRCLTWIWILFGRLNNCLKMSICDCNVPHSLDLNFVQQLRQLTQNEHYWIQMSNILLIWILFSRLNRWLKMSVIDCKCPKSLGFEFCSASKTVDSKWALLNTNVQHPFDLNFVQQVKQVTKN